MYTEICRIMRLLADLLHCLSLDCMDCCSLSGTHGRVVDMFHSLLVCWHRVIFDLLSMHGQLNSGIRVPLFLFDLTLFRISEGGLNSRRPPSFSYVSTHTIDSE